MSQRVAKMESVIQQAAAAGLAERLGSDSASVTVTRVDASPDLRHAIIWLGILGSPSQQERVFALADSYRSEVQASVASQLTTKFTPRLVFKLDTGGAYAAEIEQLLKQL